MGAAPLVNEVSYLASRARVRRDELREAGEVVDEQLPALRVGELAVHVEHLARAGEVILLAEPRHRAEATEHRQPGRLGEPCAARTGRRAEQPDRLVAEDA